MNGFKSSQAHRSIQRFRDYADDLLRSDYDTFDDRLKQFVHFCGNDEAIRNIHEQLINHPNVDCEGWLRERTSQMGSFAGSARLDFPTNVDERISLMYQLLVSIN